MTSSELESRFCHWLLKVPLIFCPCKKALSDFNIESGGLVVWNAEFSPNIVSYKI